MLACGVYEGADLGESLPGVSKTGEFSAELVGSLTGVSVPLEKEGAG